MNSSNKFQYKKVLEFLLKEQASLKSLFAFFKAMEDFQKRNIDSINQFTKEVQQLSSKLSNKQLQKIINNYSIHQTEKNHSQLNIGLINQKLSVWLQNGLQKLKGLLEKAKRMQSGKASLTEKDIQDFKTQLTEQILQLNRLEQSILNLYCHSIIKNSSMQVEELTSKMQNHLSLASKVVPNIKK